MGHVPCRTSRRLWRAGAQGFVCLLMAAAAMGEAQQPKSLKELSLEQLGNIEVTSVSK